VSVNLTASYRLIRSTEPLLRASEAGRAIFLTSGRVARPKAFWGPYGVTKAGWSTWCAPGPTSWSRPRSAPSCWTRGHAHAGCAPRPMPGEDPTALPDPSEIGPLMVELAQADLGCQG
jgi:hypothetical protein